MRLRNIGQYDLMKPKVFLYSLNMTKTYLKDRIRLGLQVFLSIGIDNSVPYKNYEKISLSFVLYHRNVRIRRTVTGRRTTRWHMFKFLFIANNSFCKYLHLKVSPCLSNLLESVSSLK